jgi:hypothetical protein
MSTITPPAIRVNPSVSDVNLDSDNLELEKLAKEDDEVFAELPQGAFALMSQVLRQHQLTLTLSVSDKRTAVVSSGKPLIESGDRRAIVLSGTGGKLEQSIGTFETTKRVLRTPTTPALADPRASVTPSLISTPAIITADHVSTSTIANTVAATEPGGSLPNLETAVVVDNKDNQPKISPVQVSFEKSQPLPIPVQTPVAAHRPLTEPTFMMPMDVRKGNEGYLKIPFSKGEAVGQVIINKPSAEVPQQLQLSTNNVDVSSLLRDSVQQLHEPRWRLVDSQNEQSGQGQGSPPQDADEDASDGFRRGPELQEAEV